MSEKRRDSKGRILRTGENQRKDGLYQFRYTDIRGKRQTVYASDLKDLREKEKEVHSAINSGLDYTSGKAPFNDVVQRYIEIKKGKVRDTSLCTYLWAARKIMQDGFGNKPIDSIKTSDAQLWIKKLKSDGSSYRTVSIIFGIAKGAFQMACDEDVVRKNPFTFKLTDIIRNDTAKKDALTAKQCEEWFAFLREDNVYSKYYDIFFVLLGTGMRISELCGLTIDDVDFDNRKIRVERQLIRRASKEMKKQVYIEKPKSSSGVRMIPMSDDIYATMKNVITKRSILEKEVEIDGCRGFVFLNQRNTPFFSGVLEVAMRNSVRKFEKKNPGCSLPTITPHILRHTFCTNMANKGLDIKSLQYIMGHSDTAVTLNVYTHAQYDHVAKSFSRIATL